MARDVRGLLAVSDRQIAIPELSSKTALTFPPHSRPVGSQFHSAFLDIWIKAKLEIPRSSVDSFIKSNHLSSEVTFHAADKNLRPGDHSPWWKPDPPSGHEVAVYEKRVSDSPAHSLVFIHTDDPRRAEVFVYWVTGR